MAKQRINPGIFRITLDVTVDLDDWEETYSTGATPEQVADTVASWAHELLTDQFNRSGIKATAKLR